MTLREVLHAHLPLLTSESTIRDAVDKMDVYQFPALVIASEEATPTHVITEGDLSRAIQKNGGLIKIGDKPAYEFASREPVTLGPDAEISDALQEMLDRGLTILPVVEDRRLLGVVLRVDLMQALLSE
ncbi:CBS domain-containing protein [Kamptonema cortianum]|nr:CBS domain-containing protein [Geitlerinema splendidum]MDK3158703.1 CBS domain-containing protein [Kamptonema cortianum]